VIEFRYLSSGKMVYIRVKYSRIIVSVRRDFQIVRE